MENKTVHHYLHEQAFGTVIAERIDTGVIVFRLRNEKYELAVNDRDQRTLVVFDGELLAGGLPRSATVIKSSSLGEIFCPSEAVRKNPEYPCVASPEYSKQNRKTSIEIFRHFILMPSSTSIVRKFRNKSLSPVYVIIRISTNEKGTKVVEWQTTSY